MTMKRAIVAVVISGVTGLGIGAYVASQYLLNFNARFMTSNQVVRTQAGLITNEKVLAALRAGDVPGATQELEGLFDGDLITAGALARTGEVFNEKAKQAVVLEQNARKVSGYEPSLPGVRSAVQESFAVLSGEGK